MGTIGNAQSSLKAMTLFSFSTAHLSQKDKVRFFYALNGRDHKSGMAKEYEIVHLGPQLLMVADNHVQDVKHFLAYWGCVFKSATLMAGEDL